MLQNIVASTNDGFADAELNDNCKDEQIPVVGVAVDATLLDGVVAAAAAG